MKSVFVQDVAKGKAKPAIKSGYKEIDWNSQVRVSSDGKLAFIVLDNPTEGDVLTIDLATNKLVSKTSPPVCAADTWR